MSDKTDGDIEEKLKEALAEIEAARGVREDGLWRRNLDPLGLLGPSPTIEHVKRAVRSLREDATQIRQHAERLELHARHLDEHLQPIQLEDVRELVRYDPESAARILYFVRDLGMEHLVRAELAADAMGDVAEHAKSFASLRPRNTRTRSED